MWYNKVNKAEKGIIMSTTWRITNDSIKPSRKAGLEPGQFHMADETLFYGVIEESDQSRWDTIRETLSPELASHILTSNHRYEGNADSLSSLDILDKVAGMVSNGVSEADVFPLLESRIAREQNAPQQHNRNEFWQTIDLPPKEWMQQDAYLARRDEDRIYLSGHGKESRLIDSCSKVLQITEDGQWVDGRMGVGVSLEVNGSHKFPYSAIPKDLATQYFDEFQVETNVLKRNDIYLLEYGINEDKAKIFTLPHSDQSENKVQAMTKSYRHRHITKLVEDGQPVDNFGCTPDIEKILLTPNHLTAEQYNDIRMAILDDSLEMALFDLVDDTAQLGQ